LFIKLFFLRTILSPKELFHATKELSLWKKFFAVFLISVALLALVWWIFSVYRYFTVPQPTYGGQYIEALIGQPRYINPLLARSSSDQSLAQLVYGSLFSYDKDGLLQPDMVERFDINDDAREYTIYLRKDIFWHDEEVFTADDVIMTISVAKDIQYGAAGVSSEMRLFWQNVNVEKIDDHTIKFLLEKPNSLFLHNLNFGILPEHIWGNINSEQFQLSRYNQMPVGTGPYEFVDYDINASQDLINSYTLRSYQQYYKGRPFITKMILNFYPTRSEAVEAYARGEVSSIIVDKKEHVDVLREAAQKRSIALPHYFSVFFNQTKSVPLAYDEVREALSRATDRKAIIAEVFGEEDASLRYSPFSEDVIGYDSEQQQAKFDPESAKVLLDEKGWKLNEDGIRSKGDDQLSIVLHVSGSHDQFVKIAEMLQVQWAEIGVALNIQQNEKADLEKNIIQPRDYDAVLYAHQMRFEPNLLPLWHSSEKNDPGMNYALFEDEKMDESLEILSKTKDFEERLSQYSTQQEQLRLEVPAVFLFAPKVSFMHSDAVKGISVNNVNTSRDRYTDVHLWYIKEKRVKK
jgi:peptide/nickel transport system substrate-binding protein